jgi:hypothetical protein
MRWDGFPHEDYENDPDAKADEEKQWPRPEHDLWPRDLAIVSVSSATPLSL